LDVVLIEMPSVRNSNGKESSPVPKPVRTHLDRLSDWRGVFQHAIGAEPDPKHGYCTDDVARALLVDLLHGERLGLPAVKEAIWSRLDFLADAFDQERVRFRNFRDANGKWLERVGSEDSHGRAVLALGEVIRRTTDVRIRMAALNLFELSAPAAADFKDLRPWAYVIIGCDAASGLAQGHVTSRLIHLLGHRLSSAFKNASNAMGLFWPWPEHTVTYDSGVLPQALIVGGMRAGKQRWVSHGLLTLRWLVGVQTAVDGHLSPIGNRGWWRRGAAPAHFDQQPIEAASILEAARAALGATRNRAWANVMFRAYAWFNGTNDVGVELADPAAGRCADGLTPTGRNPNYGAESTLAWLLAVERIRELRESDLVG
jgi:hypothetical protein